MVGLCTSVDEALRTIAGALVDVVLLDVDLGSERGTDFVRRARSEGFAGRILIVTAGLEGPEAARLLGEGIAGIFLKHGPPAALIKSIRRVAEGEAWIDQKFLPILAASSSSGASPQEQRGTLTRRERDVLRGVLDGLANKEIGQRMQASESSVKGTLQQLFHKTGVRTRSQLVRIALEEFREELDIR